MPSIKAGEINLEYFIDGSGPPLLMIMGFGGSASSWGEPFVKELGRHFTTIRLSNRGTGLSDKPSEAFTIRTMADDTVNLLDALKIDRPHVLGISMGGMIAQELAINYPQRVNGLALGCTTTGPAHGVTASTETMTLMAPQPGMTPAEMYRKAWPALCSPKFIESGVNFLEQMLNEGLSRPTPLQTIGQQMGAIMQHNTYDRLPQIKAPTLVIHGDVDLLVPSENANVLAKQIAGVEQKWVPGAAHMFFWEQPEASAKVITEFLSRVPAAA
jgi:pimeloyl-ACP methyl ester carboxylesterase